MEWRQLLSTKRSRGTSKRRGAGSDLRSEFEKDDQRIIGSASFRRLQDKTQMEVAEEIHISQAQVSRLEKNALKTMRAYLSA